MFRVEFIGLPGSGKTTIRENLVQELRKTTGQDRFLTLEEAFFDVAVRKIDRVYRFFLKSLPRSFAVNLSNALVNRSLMQFEAQNMFLAKNGKALEVFLSSNVYSEMNDNERWHVISSFLETGALLECLQGGGIASDTVVFFEEGLVQKSLMFISGSIGSRKYPSNLYSYLKQIPLPDIVLYIQAEFDTCCHRMINRPQGMIDRLKRADHDTVASFLSAADNHLQQVADWLRLKHNNRLIIVDNESDLQHVVIELTEKLKKSF